MPGLPSGLKLPGLESLTGGQTPTIGKDGRTNVRLPVVPAGGIRKQFTNRPAIEQSTKPNCAPFVFVGVPGTFEINRDDNPNKPIGMLSKITDPLSKSLGNKFGTTMINYDADAGVNGTSYKASVEAGAKKTLATVTDVASRCPKTSIIIGGYSQGANVAGNVATDIGAKRTPVDPARIAGVVLVSDPQRTPNSNVIADTNQARPDVPAFLEDAIGALSKNPTFAQLQMTTNDLLSDGGKNVAGSITNMVGQLAGNLTGGPSIAGSNPTQAPASTSLAPEPSSSDSSPDSSTTVPDPSPSVDLEPTTPKIAGSSFTATAQFQQIDDAKPLTKAADELTEVKADDADNGTMTKKVQSGVSSIGKGTEWLPISGPGSISASEFKEKAKQGGWVYGRTPQEKDSRRMVVDDLFMNAWDKCRDRTLADCRGNYVDGLTNDRVADGFMIPSSELTATRDEIKAPNYVRPEPAILDSCMSKKSKECALKAQLAQAGTEATRAAGKGGKTLPDFTDMDTDQRDKVLADIAAATTFRDGDGQQVPIKRLRDRNVGKIDAKSTYEICGKPTSKAHEQDIGEENNDWLKSAWINSTQTWVGTNPVEGKFDRSASVDDFHARSAELTLKPESRECAAWAIATFNEFEQLYKSGAISYKSGYTPSNSPDAGKGADRTKMIERIYQFGGCGDGVSAKDVSVPAPNGSWSLQACESFFGKVDGRTEKGAEFTNMQLGVLAGAAERQYNAQKPDWKSSVVPVSATEGVHKYKGGPLKCDTMSVRACAILKAEITGPKTAPAGIKKVVKVPYPAIGARGEVHFGDLKRTEQVDPPKGQSPDQLYNDGYRWATPEVIAAVKTFDDVRGAVSDGNDARKQPKSVSTLISPDGGAQSVDGKEERLIAGLIGKGYVWDYTQEKKDHRTELFGDYFRYNQCGTLSFDDCRKKVLSYGSKEYLLTPERMQDAIDAGKKAEKQGTLGYKPDQLPTDLPSCKDKAASVCAGVKPVDKKDPTTDKGDPTEPAADDAPTGPTTDSGDDGPTSSDDGTSGPAPADDDAPAPTSSSSDSNSSPDTPDTSSAPSDDEPVSDSSSDPSPSTDSVAGAPAPSTESVAGSDPSTTDTGGDLTSQFENLITGPTSTEDSTTSDSPTVSTGTNGEKVSISPITQKAVAGGGLAGKRGSDFGELKGRVVSLCVPGDIVCSLPENSELAQDLVKFAENVSLNFPDMVGDEGSTRMAGVLALQGLNTVSDITGMPRTKLTSGTLQALMNIAAGGAMLAAQQPAGAALVADGVAQLPDAMPELFAQLQDVPALLRGLSTAPQNAMENTGMSKLLGRINSAFQQAGMTSPLDVQKYPEAATALMQGLVKDNTGLVEMVTNPQYWKANAHGLYPQLKISGQTGSLRWVSQWIDNLAVLAKLR